jgi:predicted RNase H-like HicB family nuclease
VQETRYIALKIVAKWDEESGRFVAGSQDLDVWSSGSDQLEALNRANEAILLFLEDISERGVMTRVLDECGVKVFEKKPEHPDNLFGRLADAFRRGDVFSVTIPLPAAAPAPAGARA